MSTTIDALPVHVLCPRLSALEPAALHTPQLWMEDFFFQHTLPDARQKLWILLKGFINSEDSQDLTTTERSDFLRFYENLEALLEASFLLHNRPLA